MVRPSYAYHCCQFMPSTYENLVNTIFIINIFAVVVKSSLSPMQISLSKLETEEQERRLQPLEHLIEHVLNK